MKEKEYPYFLYPVVRELKETANGERARLLSDFIAVNVGDRDTLVALIGEYRTDLRNFYADESAKQHSTEATIDSFIERYGSADPVLDISDILEPKPERRRKKNPRPAPAPGPKIEPEAVEEPAVEAQAPPAEGETEEKVMHEVKILVKNREYERALAIMTHFYLNNPKKSVYFADQIRFVKKMMINERKKS